MKSMKFKAISGGAIAKLLACAFAAALIISAGSPRAFASGESLKHAAKQFGHATSEAAHEVGHGAKKVGRVIVHDAKKTGKAIGAAARAGSRAFKRAMRDHGH
ncbi:MAG: hypothetical protein M0Z84_04945 [Gammaproteobacteria bacterium]|nr:hypothetical protein [Gammaproteobacteria bacterium]